MNDYNNPLPNDENAEKALLCSLLQFPKEVAQLCASEGLNHTAFHIPAHGEIFLAASAMIEAGIPVDGTTLASDLNQRGSLEAVGGFLKLSEIQTCGAAASNSSQYINTVMKAAKLRQLHLFTKSISEQALEPGADPQSLGEYLAERASAVAAQTSGNGSLASAIRPCTELHDLPIPKREAILGDWFKQGDLGFVFAPRGLGKTWLSLGIATAISSGSKCGPWAALSARKVLYVDGEMPCESIRERTEGMGGTENLTVLNHEALFHLTGKSLNLADLTTQNALTEKMVADGTEVVILDNLSCLFSGINENEADAWEPILRWLLVLRRHRIAVVIVAHAGRNGAMRGTSRREDHAFWIIRLDEIEKEGRDGARFLSRFTKDRNSQSEQPATQWSFTTLPDKTVDVKTAAASTLDVFKQWIVDGLTSAEDIAREMGVSKGTVSKMAKRAMDAGWLDKKGRGYALK